MNRLNLTLTPMRAWLLAVLLLAAQAAGLAHRISHPQPPAAFTAALAAAQHAQATPVDNAGSGFEHKSGSADCRLIDQLMHADALCVGTAVVALLPQPRESTAGVAAIAPRAAAAASYLARAPPLG